MSMDYPGTRVVLTIPLARLVELGEEAFAEEEGSCVFLRDLDWREKIHFHVSVLISAAMAM